jgi:DNA-binding PadR family transcriptional regulator
MCGVELLAKAKHFTPKIRLRDVRLILRKLEIRNIIFCLNPSARNGRLYFYTEPGLRLLREELAIQLEQVDPSLDWNTYGWIVRGKARKAVITELGRPRIEPSIGFTATKLRKALLPTHPMGLNPMIECLKELEDRSLIACVGRTRKRDLRLMALSDKGIEILETLTL